MASPTSASDWPAAVHRVLRAAGVRQVATIPDAGLARLLALCEADGSLRIVRLTSEEEGVALLAGAWLGGERGVLLMQSSGVGNCVNVLALPAFCRLPLVMIVTMRGEPGETNAAQVPMGGAAMVGLGLALARPDRRVLVITGDGEMLMGTGSLATIAVRRPPNLAVVVLDNERYGETGMQPTHTAFGADLAGMAKAAGFPYARRIASARAVARLARRVREDAGPLFAQVAVRADRPPLVLPPNDGPLLKARFRAALREAGP